jgi:peptide/nickel transport system permease protein
MPKIVVLWTDYVVYALLITSVFYILHVRRDLNLRATWRKVFREPAPMCAAIVLGLCMLLAVLDSFHFRRLLMNAPGATQSIISYSTKTESIFDVMMTRQIEMREKDWSAPFAYSSWRKESNAFSAKADLDFPRLKFGGAHLKNAEAERAGDIAMRGVKGLVGGLLFAAFCAVVMVWPLARSTQQSIGTMWRQVWRSETEYPLRAALITITVLSVLIGLTMAWMDYYHVFGTDQTGNDVFYQALKSIRTAFVIGTLSTLATLPFAVVLGVLAGYFKGWVDDVIQYLYTTLTAVPSVLLIAACVLMVQVFIDKNPQLFDTGLERADLKLFLLCVILGLTSWATLCRLLRAETMKLRELEYVQAAVAFGVSHIKIMSRHIFPNVVHLILITTVLSFSELILYEAVLSYVGVGVDPTMNSFGGMINLARVEMSRDPIVWWSFGSAFLFMVTLVLAANLFSDGVRDAFDPRSRSFRLKLFKAKKITNPASA